MDAAEDTYDAAKEAGEQAVEKAGDTYDAAKKEATDAVEKVDEASKDSDH